MKKTIKYSILGLAALCTVVLCGGYYMLGHALKPEGLITRSRNIAESYNFMFEQYPELQPWVDSLVTVGALKDFYICLLYTSPSPRDAHESRMPSSA